MCMCMCIVCAERLGPKCDIWSFGLSLWAIAEGRFPYEEHIHEELDLHQASTGHTYTSVYRSLSVYDT